MDLVSGAPTADGSELILSPFQSQFQKPVALKLRKRGRTPIRWKVPLRPGSDYSPLEGADLSREPRCSCG